MSPNRITKAKYKTHANNPTSRYPADRHLPHPAEVKRVAEKTEVTNQLKNKIYGTSKDK